jgi:hypothetical protein
VAEPNASSLVFVFLRVTFPHPGFQFFRLLERLFDAVIGSRIAYETPSSVVEMVSWNMWLPEKGDRAGRKRRHSPIAPRHCHSMSLTPSFPKVENPECPKCKSADTGSESLANTRPSLFYTLLIGWIYLLPRAAFTARVWRCRACGETFHRRTMGSYLALLIVLSLGAWIVVEIFEAYGPSGR